MSQKALLIFSTIIVIFLTVSCSTEASPSSNLTPVTVQLAWTHQNQFAGLYVADQKGYYAEEGLAIDFIEGGANIDKFTPLLDGTAQFGIAGADELILARDKGEPVKAVATIYRKSPIVFISLAEKGITKPKQFLGQTIRAPNIIVPTLNAMMTRLGILPDQYSYVDTPSDIQMFTSGDIPIWGVYSNSFLITVENAGIKVNTIYPDDYGVHFYSDTLITTDALITSDPDLVLRFTRASLKGWTYALENPQEIPLIVQKYFPEVDLTLENQKFISSIRLVNTGEDNIGWMKSEIWTGMTQTMLEQKLIKQTPANDDLFTMQFLEAIYNK